MVINVDICIKAAKINIISALIDRSLHEILNSCKISQ